jgi:hypothetical protein
VHALSARERAYITAYFGKLTLSIALMSGESFTVEMKDSSALSCEVKDAIAMVHPIDPLLMELFVAGREEALEDEVDLRTYGVSAASKLHLLPKSLKERQQLVKQDAAQPSFVAFGMHSWYMQWQGGAWNAEGLGVELLWELEHAESDVACLALGSNDSRWWYRLEDGTSQWFNCSSALHKVLKAWPAEYVQFFDDSGYFIKFKDGTTSWENAPSALANLAHKYPVERVYSNGGSGWLATFTNGSWEYKGLPSGLCAQITSQKPARDIQYLALSPDGASYFASLSSRFFWNAPWNSALDTLMDPTPENLNPGEISFTNNAVSRWFRNGKSLDVAISLLRSGAIDVADFPPIRVAFHERVWWSLDNRRLYCFREAGLLSVPVQAVEVTSLLITGDGDVCGIHEPADDDSGGGGGDGDGE